MDRWNTRSKTAQKHVLWLQISLNLLIFLSLFIYIYIFIRLCIFHLYLFSSIYLIIFNYTYLSPLSIFVLQSLNLFLYSFLTFSLSSFISSFPLFLFSSLSFSLSFFLHSFIHLFLFLSLIPPSAKCIFLAHMRILRWLSRQCVHSSWSVPPAKSTATSAAPCAELTNSSRCVWIHCSIWLFLLSY